MDKKTVFVKTSKGESEAKDKGGALSGDLKRALFLIDGKSTFEEILKRAAPSLRDILPNVFSQLVVGGYLRDKDKPFAEPVIATPKIIAPGSSGELDFTGFASVSASKAVAPEAGKQSGTSDADATRAHAELEAAVEAAKIKARAEAEAKAEANAKSVAQLAARSKAEADIRAKQDALVREQAEAKAKQEAEARVRAEQAAAQAKQQLEAAAKAKAEAEALVRQQMEIAIREKAEAEERARQAAEAARIKAEQEAAKVKAELEAAAKARQEAEAARLRAEQEAARATAELEAARAKAEAEARALAEERARQEAEAARLKAEQEAARVKAEQEAARAKAEAEAKAKALAEERARQEADAARLKAEQEAARVKAEQEAARVKAEAEARAAAEQRARQEAEVLRLKAEQEAASAKAELDAVKAKVEAEARALAEQRALQEADAARLKIEQDAHRAKEEAAAKLATQPKTGVQQEQDALRAADDERMKSAQAKQAAEKAGQEAAAQRANLEAQKLADEQAKTWAAAEQRAKAQAQAEAERPSQPAAVETAKSAPQKVASVRRKPLPLGKIAAGLFVLLLLSVVLLPYVMPLSSYVAPLEQKLSAQFNQPVHVGSLHAASLPWPKLILEKVAVGSAQELKVGNAEVTFDLFSLFSPVKVIRRVELQDVTLEGASFDKELSWLQQIGANANYPVSHVTLQRAKVSSEEISLPVFSGEIDVNEQGRVSNATLKSADAKFDAVLQPSSQDRWQITLNAKETSFPLFPNVLFNDLTAKGEVSAAGANFAAIEGQAYGGFFNGSAKLNWQKGWQLQGRIEARTVELNKLFPKFGVTGELAGASNFVASGLKLGKLGDAPQMDGTFVAKKGVVNGMDMVETARGNRQNGAGGRTNFDELTGVFQVNGRGPHFQQLKLSSGILNASGSFDVNGGGQISGRLSVELKARAGASSLALSGTLTEPVLRSGR